MLPELSDEVKGLLEKVKNFMDKNIYPNEKSIEDEIGSGDRWQPSIIIEDLKTKAKSEKLWKLF